MMSRNIDRRIFEAFPDYQGADRQQVADVWINCACDTVPDEDAEYVLRMQLLWLPGTAGRAGMHVNAEQLRELGFTHTRVRTDLGRQIMREL
jgi:hypothetical protein